jgi:hypothetical protein
MATLDRAHESTYDAEDAIKRLVAAGVPATEIELIMGEPIKDSRDAPIGTFAGTTTADALTVGSYAGIQHSGRKAMGTFAGDPETQRVGSFGDVDRDTVTTCRAGVRRTRIASHHRVEQILVQAGLDRASAQASVKAMHAGRVLVLVQSESSLDDLDQGAYGHQTLRAAA